MTPISGKGLWSVSVTLFLSHHPSTEIPGGIPDVLQSREAVSSQLGQALGSSPSAQPMIRTCGTGAMGSHRIRGNSGPIQLWFLFESQEKEGWTVYATSPRANELRPKPCSPGGEAYGNLDIVC